MRDEYRQLVSQQHAPQELIERTVYKVKTQESSHSSKRRKVVFYASFSTLAVCAIIAVVILTVRPPQEFYYTVGTELKLKSDTVENRMEEIFIKDYEDHLLVPLRTMIPDARLMDDKIFVAYDSNHEKIIKDQAILFYEWKEHTLIVRLSKTEDMTPDVLKDARETKVHSITYRLLSSEDGDRLMASCEIKGIHFLYICNQWTKKDFETFLLSNQYSY